MIRLLAVDIDDTLLNDDLVIPEDTNWAIAKARELGIMVTLVTGRMFQSSVPFARELALSEDQPIITYNGAMTRTIGGELINHIPIDRDVAEEVITLCQAKRWTLNVYHEDNLYVDAVNENVRYYQALGKMEVFPVGNLLDFRRAGDKELSKLLIVGKEEEIAERVVEMQKLLGERAHVVRSKKRFIEITHPKANKGAALKNLAESLGFEREEVMAIGDSNNDVSMIKYAGVGVAVGNALPNVKEAADFVADNKDKSAVAHAIHEIILQSHNIS